MAIVAEGQRGSTYLSADKEHVNRANEAKPSWMPNADLPHNPRDFKTPNYGMTTFADLFTSRQLVALTTFSNLVSEARERVLTDAIKTGMPDNKKRLNDNGTGAYSIC
jgi:putative DNA methylase